MQKIDLAGDFALIHEHWSPKIIAELNGQHIKLARLMGEFVWHRHPAEDELFIVLHGELTIRFRNGEATFREGEMIVVPRGWNTCRSPSDEVEVSSCWSRLPRGIRVMSSTSGLFCTPTGSDRRPRRLPGDRQGGPPVVTSAALAAPAHNPGRTRSPWERTRGRFVAK